ncbi:MAG TPA: DMT family transporter [Acidimicrobiales bacterium]|nr:DMT family transporter [Acidimicrobiales bacterium]
MTRRGWVLFVALGVIWGIPYLLIRVTVREMSPALLVLVRTGGGALLLAPFVARRRMLAPVLRRWRPLLVYSFVETGVPWLLLFQAERRLSSSLAGLLVAAVPIVGAVLAQLTGTDRLDRRRVAGLVLGMCGVAALVGLDVGRSSALSALSLAAVAVGYALGPWIVGRYLSDLPALSVVACSLAICAAVYAPVAVFELPSRPLSGSVIWSLVCLTVLCTAIAFVCFYALIAEIGALRSTVITYVNPAVAVVLGVAVLGEPFGLGTAVGFVLILSGSFLATRPLRAASPSAAQHEPGAARVEHELPAVGEP